MSRALAIGLAAFAAIVLLGVLLLSPSARQRGAALELGPVLPALSKSLNTVSAITLSDVEDTLSLERVEGVWRFKALPGIPVDQGKVREFLLDLTQAMVLEAKTDNPNFHTAIGLGAAGTRIDLGAAGRLILGKEGAGGGRFVRRAGEDQTYLAKGVSAPQIALKAWATLTLPVARKEQVKQVRVDDGIAPYTVSVGGETQTLEGLQEGEALAYDGVLDTVVAAAVFLDYDDIRPAGEINWDRAGTTTFSGPEQADSLVYEVVQAEGKTWLRVNPAGAFLPQSDIDWARWAFEISDYRKETLLKPRRDLLASAEPPAADTP